MKAKIVKFRNDDGKELDSYEEQVIFTLGEYPDKMPVVNFAIPHGDSEEESLSISLNIKELQELISADTVLKWLKKKEEGLL